MSRQLSLDTFFKTKQKSKNISRSMTELKKKTRKTKPDKKINLSATKSPTLTKLSKINKEAKKQVISLSSDDEDFFSPLFNVSAPNLDLSQRNISSDSSQSTLPYSLTPERSAFALTPLKTPQSRLSPKSSPGSRTKFYSPIKKRIVTKRTPVKRKLEAEFIGTQSPVKENHDYMKDDKTKALINIITQCLENGSLKRLLAEENQMLLDRCLSVLKPGMRVVCRLYWRKAGWYKVDQLKAMIKEDLVDDPTFNLMLDSLITNGLLVRGAVDNGGGNLTFDDLASILKADELKQICKDLKLKMQSKQNAIDALRSYCRMSSIGNYFTGSSQSNKNRVLRIMTQQAGPCFKLSDVARKTLEKLYLLMYLGINYNIIREKRLEVTILYDKVKRETYPVDNDMELDDASVVFENKEQFDRYFTAHCIYEDFLERTELNEKCDIVNKVYTMYKGISEGEMLYYKALPLWLRRYTPAHVYIKILEAGVVELKKNKTKEHNTLAVEILTSLINQVGFRQHKKADWYSEKALILYNLEQYDEAATVLLEGLNSNLEADAKDSLRPRVRKLSARASDWLRSQLAPHADRENTLEKHLPAKHIYKQPMDRTTNRGKVKFETRLESSRVVQDAEQYCMSHYITSGDFTHGGHWEGSIVTTIFFLLFWDIIYQKPRARGIFLTRYQSYPLDMFCESFYTNRQTDIEERLAVVELCTTEEMLDIMSDKWNSRDPCELSGINWSIGWDSVSAVSRCLGPQRAAALCRRLARQYRYTHSGFPDLTLWHAHTGQIKFVEVKTDSDKPSMKQIQWMHYLQENGIDTEFCYVGVNTTRCKARAS